MKLYCSRCEEKTEVDYPSMVIGPPAYDKYEETETEAYWACTTCETIIVEPLIQGKFIDMPFDTARAEKFRIGRAEHGPVFLRDPLEEVDMELIDAVNYCEEGIRQGIDEASMREIILKLHEADVLVRKLYRERLL